MYKLNPQLGLEERARFSASLVVSVYKDVEKLNSVFYAVSRQVFKNFEVIISEDGESTEMASYLSLFLEQNPRTLQHLTQPDLGFRKTRALNRAISNARSDYLIFIDGDCLPHPKFVQAHISEADLNIVCSGRRVELGVAYSQRLVDFPPFLDTLSSLPGYLARLVSIELDHGKNPESGVYWPWLHGRVRSKPLNLVGCNMSCFKVALEAINGFNEDYQAPGTGEDTDIEWRLTQAGYKTRNLKFLAPLFHLHHERKPHIYPANEAILERTRKDGAICCVNGLEKRRAASSL